MRESDLTFRLENGTTLWEPLWSHEKPGIMPFVAAVIIKETELEDKSGNTTEGPSSCQVLGKSHESDNCEDFSAATFFDVAVLKCLSSIGWAEDGVIWALCYLSTYLKKEFHLPNDQVPSSNGFGEKEIAIPVQDPDTSANENADSTMNVMTPVVNMHSEVVHKGDPITYNILTLESSEGEGSKHPKSADGITGDVRNPLTTETKMSNDDKGEADIQKGVKMHDSTKDVHSLEPSHSIMEGNIGNNLESDLSHRVLSNHDNHDDKDGSDKLNVRAHDKVDAAPSLERTGSTRLRIRVQSSPVMSHVGRVFAAVASPPRNVPPYEATVGSSENLGAVVGDTATSYNPKIFIRPPASLMQSTSGVGNGNKPTNEGSSLGFPDIDVAMKSDAQENSVSSSSEAILLAAAVTPEQVAKPTLVEPSNSTDTSSFISKSVISNGIKPDEHEPLDPYQGSKRDAHSGLELPNSLEWHESGRESHATFIETGIPVGQKEYEKETLVNKGLSEQASVSLASTSSIDSEKHTVELPFKWPGQARKQTMSIGSLDSSQNSTNRDSLLRTERYFVISGAAEYITTDGRLSVLGILQAVSIVMQGNPSPRVCAATLTVLQHLMMVHERTKFRKRGSCADVDDRTVAEAQAVGFRSPHSENVLGRLRASFYGRPPSFISLAMVCLIKLVKSLGCPLGTYNIHVIVLLLTYTSWFGCFDTVCRTDNHFCLVSSHGCVPDFRAVGLDLIAGWTNIQCLKTIGENVLTYLQHLQNWITLQSP